MTQEKINIAEILKDVPEGTELYCSIFGYVKFIRVKDTGYANMIQVDVPIKGIEFFYEDGRYNKYYSDSECVLFPSKENRDWSKFHLEKLIVPKFKVGDRIRKKGETSTYTITDVNNAHYFCGTYVICDTCDNDWTLVPNKFDINTLVPYESKVLVRDGENQYWSVSFWGCFFKCEFMYDTVRGRYKQCIPYEGNEHLLGKKYDCDEYYKTW